MEWNHYEAAIILRVDTEKKSVSTCVEYRSPLEARASETSSVVFKSGTLAGNILYACTSTEVLIFELPEFRRVGYISLPCFNDVHHVTPSSDGALLAANTGLDMVVKFSKQGELLDAWNVLQEPAWSRFAASVDYRKVDSTQPHRSHPNFVFQLDEELWVTRFCQRDAICLNDTSKRICIPAQYPHDGLLNGGRLYFTSVDGKVVIVNPKSYQAERVVDLQEIEGTRVPLGWCRGLLPVDKFKFWVGFTRFRKTRFTENVLWVRNFLQDRAREKPTHISLYDLANGRCLEELDLEPYGMNVIFSIFPAVPAPIEASFDRRFPSPDTQAITVNVCDANNAASAPNPQIVIPQTTVTTLNSSLNPSVVNQTVTYTAVVTGQNGGMPTGEMIFTINWNMPVTVQLGNGQATFTWTYGRSGRRNVTASYSGDAKNQASFSTLIQTVEP
jgi:hypothetical protein